MNENLGVLNRHESILGVLKSCSSDNKGWVSRIDVNQFCVVPKSYLSEHKEWVYQIDMNEYQVSERDLSDTGRVSRIDD